MNRKFQSALVLPRAFTAAIIFCGCLYLTFPARAATTWIWNGGGGGDGKWSNALNWFGAGIPANGDSVIFQGAAGFLSTNNIPNLTLNQIKFNTGGFTIRGNSFTLTNSILCTNTSGANTIECPFITLATNDVVITVSNGVSLTLGSQLVGSVGVVKTGSGTLNYQTLFGDNLYTGTTLVADGTLTLNVSGFNAYGGPLVIGTGPGVNATVRLLQNQEMPDNMPVTINGGTLDLDGYAETIGASLTFNSGGIQTGTGLLSLPFNTIITLTSAGTSTITGAASLGGGTLTLQGNGTLLIGANITGSANIVQNDQANVSWYGTNTYTGNYTVNASGYVDLENSKALGNTNNTMTLNGQSLVAMAGVNVTNKSLTINSTNLPPGFEAYGTIYSYDNLLHSNSWRANFILNSACTINAKTNADLTLNITTNISGAGGFTKLGTGGLMLSGPNDASSYAGDTVVNEGILYLKSQNVIRNGTLRIGDGLGGAQADVVRCLKDSCIAGGIGGSYVVITNSGLLDLNGFADEVGPVVMDGATINTGAGLLTLAPPLTTLASGNGTSTINGHMDISAFNFNSLGVLNGLTINATIAGPITSTLAKSGSGDLHLFGANTYNGPTLIQEGYVWAGTNLALGTTNSGTIVSSIATLVLDGTTSITNEALTLNGPGATSLWGALDVEAGIHTWAGPITNNANSTLDSWGSGSELHINGPISGAGGLELFNAGPTGGTHFFEGVAANTYAGTTTVDAGCVLALKKNVGDGALTNSLIINGTVRDLAINQIDNLAPVTIGPAGLLDLSGGGDGVGSLDGSGSINLGGNFINSFGTGVHTYNGIISGAGNFFMSGTMSLTLNGNNTYLGETHLYDAAIAAININGSQPQSAVYLGSGDTLGGTGVVGVVTANGTIAPGNAGPGILTSSNVNFSATGGLKVELTGPNPGAGGYDQLNVRGTVSLANATLNVIPAFTTPVAIGQQFTILNNDQAEAITGTFNGLPNGSIISVGGYKFIINYSGAFGNDVVLTLTNIPGAAVGSAVTAGNGSHSIDPNDCNNLSLIITNTTGSAMTGVKATLSTTTFGVVVTGPYVSYPDIPAHGTATNIGPFQISTQPGFLFVCGTPISLQLSVDSSIGSFTTSYVQPTGESAPPVRFDNNTLMNCPDIGTIESTNTVSGWSGGALTKVTVSLWLVAPFASDMSLSLISPSGTNVPLFTATGAGGNANFGSGSADGSRTVFDDSAATAITAGAPPYVGTFKPQGTLASFTGANFSGASVNGDWRLRIQDSFGSGSQDTLRAWSLFLSGTTCASGSGPCDYCLTSITGVITNTDPVQTGGVFRNAAGSSCGAPKAWPGVVDGASRHYDIYAFTNTTGDDACVTITLRSPGDLQALIYLNSFNPADISTNYLGDASGGSTQNNSNVLLSSSASIPNGAKFFVTVNERVPNVGTNYVLQLSGLPCPPPVLNIQPVGGNKARVFWGTSGGGYQLESVSNLMASAWGGVTNEPIVTGGNYAVTNSTVGPATNRFYRLHKP